MKFSDLGLSPKVLAAVEAVGYTTPTPIQEQAIPHVLARRDVVGIAQTGTGKTAGFVLPMLTMLEQGRARARMPRTLILEPTRELAAQVEDSFNKYGKGNRLTVALLIGGVSFDDQLKKLDRGVDVLIATPGRLLDHFERGKLLLTGCEILVIDEADRMLDMGFIPDVERICKLLPFTRQTLFFSATMPPEIKRLADNFLSNPVRVEASPPSTVAETVRQQLAPSGREPVDKRAVLRALIRGADNFKNAIIFCNRKRDVAVLHRSLEKHGFSVGALHGDMDQRARMTTLDDFRKDRIALLVASDVAARGLDIPAVSHIFNFDVPTHAEDYIHRIGRTGRAGLTGTAITIATPIDRKYIGAIERMLGKSIPPMDVPEAAEERAKAFNKGRAERAGAGAGTQHDEEAAAPAERRGRRERGGRGRRPREETRPVAAAAVPSVEQAAPRSDSAPAQTEPRHERTAQPAPDRQRESHRDRPARVAAERHPEPQRARPPQPVAERRPEPHRDHVPQPRPQESQRPRQQDDRHRDRSRREGGPPVIGMGDHMPDFLRRPVKIPSSD
jgi:superfamily II DNA/RNA helicase